MTLSPNWPRRSDASIAAWIASLPPQQRERELRKIAPTPQDLASLEFSWRFWARPKQFEPPGDWLTWLVLAGRGFGKTRTGSEWIRTRVENGAQGITIVGRTAGDVRDVMIEGESGLLRCSPPWDRPRYEPSKRRLTWPDRRSRGGSIIHGAVATTYSADEPDQMRGPQGDTAWCDELAAWRYADAWDQVQLGLRSERSGLVPRCIVTTTPRPTPLIRSILKDPTTYRTSGSTYENRGNMAASFFERVRRKYEGSRLGRQELHAEVLDDTPGALWSRDLIDKLRVRKRPEKLKRIGIGVDPAVSNNEGSAETGIVAAGLAENGEGYVLADRSGRYSPGEWASVVVKLFDELEADFVVAEVNQGGDLVESNMRTVRRSLPILKVRAARGKKARAEPIASLYEQERVHHVGAFPELEDQQCTWVPGGDEDSPDRLDADVWILTELMVDADPNRNESRRKGIQTYESPMAGM